jgi:Ca2+-binding RTX toxin-like protein
VAGQVVTIRDEGATLVAGVGCTAIDAHEVQCSPILEPALGSARVRLGDQDDVATILSGEASVSGGAGDDHITSCDGCETSVAGNGGDDTISASGWWIEGGPGADVITGGTGEDQLFGGPGNDTITGGAEDDWIHPGLGDDVVEGGAGHDAVWFQYWQTTVDVSLRAGTATGQGDDTLLGLEAVYGTYKADRLIGNARNNFLNGGGGRDVLIGGRGDDVLVHGSKLFGGPGNDRLQGEDGDDLLVGGLGHDRLLGGKGNDRFGARDGARDRVNGGAGVDRGRFDSALDAVWLVEIRL